MTVVDVDMVMDVVKMFNEDFGITPKFVNPMPIMSEVWVYKEDAKSIEVTGCFYDGIPVYLNEDRVDSPYYRGTEDYVGFHMGCLIYTLGK